MPFLLNRYVKHVNLTPFSRCCMNGVKERLLEISDTVQELTVEGSLWDSSISTIVSHLVKVECLKFSHSKITDATLKVVGKHCPNLKNLILYYCVHITDKGLENLCYPYENGAKTRCHLQSLNFENTMVTDRGAEYLLQNMESLENFRYENLPNVLRNIYKTNTTKKYNLNKVIIEGELPENVIACSVLFPKIKTLRFLNIYYAQALNNCTNFSYLENVTLKSLSIELSVDKFLELRGPQLLNLNLDSFSVSTSTLIRYCPKLAKLYLHNMHFNYTDEEICCWFQFLKLFYVEAVDLSAGNTDKSLATILSLCPNLSELTMDDCGPFASKETTREILKMPALKSVDFVSTDIDVTIVETLIFTGSCIESVLFTNCPRIGLSEYQLLMAKLRSVNSKVYVDWEDTSCPYEYDSINRDDSVDMISINSNDSLDSNHEFDDVEVYEHNHEFDDVEVYEHNHEFDDVEVYEHDYSQMD